MSIEPPLRRAADHAIAYRERIATAAARWLLDLPDLPREASVGFVTGATAANFVCLAAARGEMLRRAGWDVEAKGLFGAPELHVVIGDDAHSTVFSELQFLGLGHDRVRRVATDDQGRVRPAEFERVVESCRGPMIVVLQAGQLNSGAFDPMPASAIPRISCPSSRAAHAASRPGR